MSEDTKQPGSEEPMRPDGSPADSSGTPSPSAIPPAGELAGADAEKAAMVEQAKSRVAAVKESLAAQPAEPGAPKPPVKKKEDRKSTRLNSSHGYISYAVFCLKKK